MAFTVKHCGFEYGVRETFWSWDGATFVCDGTARSGQSYMKVRRTAAEGTFGPVTSVYTECRDAMTYPGTAVVAGRFAIRFREFPSTGTVYLWYIADNQNSSYGFGITVHPDGTVYAAEGGTPNETLVGTCALNQWYLVEFRLHYDAPTSYWGGTNGECHIDVTVPGVGSAGTARGTRKDRRDFTWDYMARPHDDVHTAYEFDYDDFFIMAATGATADTLCTLPAATKMKAVLPKAAGTYDEWAGAAWYHLRKQPCEFSNGVAVNDASGSRLSVRLPTTAELGISGIERMRVGIASVVSAAGAPKMQIDHGTTRIMDPTGSWTSYGTWGQYTHEGHVAMDDETFDSGELLLTFTQTGGGVMYVDSLLTEVLYTADVPAAPPVRGFKITGGSYVGNGAFQTITGLGFDPDYVLVRATYASASEAYAMLYGRHSWGTQSQQWYAAGYASMLAIQALVADGFSVGPHTSVNKSGRTYLYIAWKDSGTDLADHYVLAGGYGGRDLSETVEAAGGEVWAIAALFLSHDFRGSCWRPKDLINSDSGPYSGQSLDIHKERMSSTSKKTALTTTGFVVTDASPSESLYTTRGEDYYWFALRSGLGCQVGTYEGTGSGGHSVTGLPFRPSFVLVNPLGTPIGTQYSVWRSGLFHTGSSSGYWYNNQLITTGITELTDDGFSVGTTLNASDTYYWIAFPEEYIAPLPDPPVLDLWEEQGAILCPPSRNYALGAAVTVQAASALTNYPLSNGVDGSLDTVLRLDATTGTIKVDLGAGRTVNFVALLNHNLDANVKVNLRAGVWEGIGDVLNVAFVVAERDTFIDLRGLNLGAARYWQFEIVDANSQDIAIGEILIGTGYSLDKVLSRVTEQERYWNTGGVTEQQVRNVVHSGTMTRSVNLDLVLYPEDAAVFEAVFDEVGVSGGRVFFVPDAIAGECYLVDWTAVHDHTVPNTRETRLTLDLVEQNAGVLA